MNTESSAIESGIRVQRFVEKVGSPTVDHQHEGSVFSLMIQLFEAYNVLPCQTRFPGHVQHVHQVSIDLMEFLSCLRLCPPRRRRRPFQHPYYFSYPALYVLRGLRHCPPATASNAVATFRFFGAAVVKPFFRFWEADFTILVFVDHKRPVLRYSVHNNDALF